MYCFKVPIVQSVKKENVEEKSKLENSYSIIRKRPIKLKRWEGPLLFDLDLSISHY